MRAPRQRLGGCFEGAVDRRLVMGEGDEPGLELRGRRVDAAVEHRALQKRAWASRSQARAPSKSRTGAALKKSVTRPGGGGDLEGAVGGERLEAGGEAVGEGAEALVGGGVEAGQGRQAGRDRQRVARERPGLVDVAGRGDSLHRLARAGVGRRRQAAADHLAEHGQVGFDAVQLLGAAAGDAEAGDHLVEDEQGAGLAGGLAEELEEAVGGWDDAHVGGDRLGQEGGDRDARRGRGRPPRDRSTGRRRWRRPGPR